MVVRGCQQMMPIFKKLTKTQSTMKQINHESPTKQINNESDEPYITGNSISSIS
jgi:hypothetical protein